jgi:hypothetical protein
MKLYSSNANFNQFHFLETMYTRFYLDEAILLSIFINYLPCHKKLCGTSFNKNETLIESS